MFKTKGNVCGAVALIASLGLATSAQAAPVNGTGLVTPDVIFGSGNANGSWTGENFDGIEVALRGKLRYNSAGLPENTFNYDGIRTYTFDPTSSVIPANRSVFNFEYSVNVDANGASGIVLNDLTYELSFDIDPTAAVNFLTFNPINGAFAITDNATGNNSTLNGGGADPSDIPAPPPYLTRLLTDSIAQNSQNRGFGFSGGLPADQTGIFTYNLLVRDSTNLVLASSSIDIVVAPSAVPVPAALPLFGTGLAIMGFVGWRRRKVVTA